MIPILYGYECPPTQQNDTYSVCNIFKNTNIASLTQRNMTINNYCDWNQNASESVDMDMMFYGEIPPYGEISCNLNNKTITSITLLALVGTLNTAFSWPPHLEQLILYADNNYNQGMYVHNIKHINDQEHSQYT